MADSSETVVSQIEMVSTLILCILWTRVTKAIIIILFIGPNTFVFHLRAASWITEQTMYPHNISIYLIP